MNLPFPRRTLAPFCLAVAMLPDAGAACQFAKVAEMPLMWADNGHPMVSAEINGKPVFMLFDTGATATVLTRQGAESQGLSVEPSQGYSYGVGGSSSNMAAAVDEFLLGPSRAQKIRMWVMGSADLGDDIAGMVGADYSMQMDMEVAFRDEQVRFFRSSGCEGAYLGYWDKDAMEVPLEWPGSFDKRPYVQVELNGQKVRALIDTGANLSTVKRKTAEKLGVNLDTARQAGMVRGVGERKAQMWVARFDFRLGDEQIRDAALSVVDDQGSDGYAGMVLGQDWLRAHRLLFARSQKRMIYSYLGGRLFITPRSDS